MAASRSHLVVARIHGGLGTQMFQYALGRNLARCSGARLKLDLTWYDGVHARTLRQYRLHHFHIQAEQATAAEIARAQGIGGWPGVAGKVGRRINRLRPYVRRSWVQEQGPQFDPHILQRLGTVYLDGYWQSEQYFAASADVLRQEFQLRNAPDAANAAMLRQIDATSAVSVHVRRGDYVTDAKTNQYHGVCSLDYYAAAVNYLTRTVTAPHFFVFSDDPQWCREHLRFGYPVTLVEHNGAEQDYEDLRLMSRCQHHIIANSSFSWWGAWLGSYTEKLVIAPRQWYADPTRHAADRVPDEWVRL